MSLVYVTWEGGGGGEQREEDEEANAKRTHAVRQGEDFQIVTTNK